jgi:hypothetical protein
MVLIQYLRGKIMALYNEAYSERQIADRLELSKLKFHDIIKFVELTGSSTPKSKKKWKKK